MSPGLISCSKPAASNTVSIFATRPVCGDSERAFIYHTFDPITVPLCVPRLLCRDAAGPEPLLAVASIRGTTSDVCRQDCPPCYRKMPRLSNLPSAGHGGRFVHHLPAHDGGADGKSSDPIFGKRQQIILQDNEIGPFSGFNRAFFLLFEGLAGPRGPYAHAHRSGLGSHRRHAARSGASPGR